MKKSKRVKKSNSWKIKQHRDQFFKKSKTLGYRSRAAFKLIELNDKFKFIKKNTKLDYHGKVLIINLLRTSPLTLKILIKFLILVTVISLIYNMEM